MSANSRQIGGNHYKAGIEPWDYILSNNIGFMEGNIIKYVSRWQRKDGIADLEKAKHYIEKLLEVAQDESDTTGRKTEDSGI